MQYDQSLPAGNSTLPRSSASAPTRALFALALALLTGLALGQLVFPSALTEQSASGSSQALRTGADFYDAIDAYIASGEAGALRGLVQPDFVNHVDGEQATQGIEAFIHQLDALRAAVAGARVAATPLSSNGDMVRFSVSYSPGENGTVFGLPFSGTGPSAVNDTLRIADGRVAERWSDLRLPLESTALASFAWDPPAGSQMLPAIERITMLRGSKMTLKVGTAHLIVVESGALTIEGTDSSPPVAVPASMQSVGAESLVALPGSAVFKASSSPYHITNDGPGVASALLIRIAGYALPTGHPELGAFGTSQNDDGVQIDLLSAAVPLPHHEGAWTIQIGRATVSTGMTIPPHEVDGSELLYAEAGALDADLSACAERCVQTTDSAGTFASEQSPVQAGQGISASDGVTTSYRVAGSAPATLLIVTVEHP